MPAESPAWWRGTAAGLLTAALAVAAHGGAGAAVPVGAAGAQLAVVAATVGAVVAGLPAAARVAVLIGLLSAGQLLAHLMLSAVGHAHAPGTPTSMAAMVAAHTVAVVAGAVLITAGDRLGRALSRAVRVVGLVGHRPAPDAVAVTVPRPTGPPLRVLMLAYSLSRRGPPVGCAP